MSRVIDSCIEAVIAVLIVAFGATLGSAVCFVSHHTIVGAIALTGVMLAGLIYAGFLLRLLSEMFSLLAVMFVKALAHTPGYDVVSSSREMSHAMTVRMFSALGTLIAVGAAIGVMVVR